jgi:hypothetical protein
MTIEKALRPELRIRGGALLLLAAGLACGSHDSSKDNQNGQDLGASGPVFGDGTDTGLTGAGTGFAGAVCAGQTAGAEVAPSVLQLLVDTSGSMAENAPGGRGSKWTVTRKATLDAIDSMPGDTSLGLVFYPNVPNNSQPCFDQKTAVAVAPLAAAGSAQRQKLTAAFTRQNPQGGTPTHDAYRYALSQIEATAAAGSRFLVLITDGTPTYSLGCKGTGRTQDAVDTTPLINEAATALANGIRTFVIGSPGSESARSSLSRMAEAGGTAAPQCSHNGPNYCHFDMTTQSDLATGLAGALQQITGIALSCNYAIPDPPAGGVLDPSKVNVLFTPPNGAQELIPQSASGCSDGWQYSSDQSQIQLCGNTCDRVRSSNGALTLQFGCTTQLH